jgi:hypothetical protein
MEKDGIKKVGNREFIILWIEFFLFAESLAFLAAAAFIFMLSFLGVSWSWLLLAAPIPMTGVLIWVIYKFIENVLDIPANNVELIEKFGRKCEPLKSGRYFFCPYFREFRKVALISMKQFTIFLMVGSRDGVPPDILEEYTSGSQVDLPPKTGDNIKFLAQFEMIVTNPLLAFYAHEDSIDYVTSLIEIVIGRYVSINDNEGVVTGYKTYNWMLDICALGGKIDNYGLKVLSFRPINVITSQAAINDRAKIQSTIRQGTNLKGEVDNMVLRAKIAEVDSAIAKQRLDYLISTGLSPEEAAKIVKTEMSMKAIIEATNRGELTYVGNNDGSIGSLISAGNVLKNIFGKNK